LPYEKSLQKPFCVGFFNKRQKLASEKATTIRMRGAFYVKPLCGHLEVLHIFRGIFEGKKTNLEKATTIQMRGAFYVKLHAGICRFYIFSGAFLRQNIFKKLW